MRVLKSHQIKKQKRNPENMENMACAFLYIFWNYRMWVNLKDYSRIQNRKHRTGSVLSG